MRPAQNMGMKKAMVLAVGLLGFAAAAPAYQMNSYAVVGGKAQPVFAWCDSPSRVLALANGNKTQLFHWAKSRAGLGSLSTSQVTVGAADPGAGQVYYSLKVTAGSRNGQSGFLHTSNVENVQDPAYRMTHINEFKLGKDIYSCRYVPHAAFLGVTSKRTVIVWDTGDVITYATRNFDGSTGAYVTDGKKLAPGIEGGSFYQFTASDGYAYHINIDPNGPGTGGNVSVYKDGKRMSTESFVAYSVSTFVVRP